MTEEVVKRYFSAVNQVAANFVTLEQMALRHLVLYLYYCEQINKACVPTGKWNTVEHRQTNWSLEARPFIPVATKLVVAGSADGAVSSYPCRGQAQTCLWKAAMLIEWRASNREKITGLWFALTKMRMLSALNFGFFFYVFCAFPRRGSLKEHAFRCPLNYQHQSQCHSHN